MKDLPFYPHLGMTEDQFELICEELFRDDPVLASYLNQIDDQQAKRDEYETRVQAFLADIRAMEAKEDELNAQMKTLTRQKRETHGLIAGMKYHISLTERREQQAKARIERRKRQLYLNEARRRLNSLGKELKLGRGRRVEKGLPAAVIDKNKPSENQEAQ